VRAAPRRARSRDRRFFSSPYHVRRFRGARARLFSLLAFTYPPAPPLRRLSAPFLHFSSVYRVSTIARAVVIFCLRAPHSRHAPIIVAILYSSRARARPRDDAALSIPVPAYAFVSGKRVSHSRSHQLELSKLSRFDSRLERVISSSRTTPLLEEAATRTRDLRSMTRVHVCPHTYSSIFRYLVRFLPEWERVRARATSTLHRGRLRCAYAQLRRCTVHNAANAKVTCTRFPFARPMLA